MPGPDHLSATVHDRTALTSTYLAHAAPESMTAYLDDWEDAYDRLGRAIGRLREQREARTQEKADGRWPPPRVDATTTNEVPVEAMAVDAVRVWHTLRQEDMTEGRGRLVRFGPVYATEQEAWDAVNSQGGVMGRFPGRNCYPMEKLVGCRSWQDAKQRLGHAIDYDVQASIVARSDAGER